MNATVAAKPVAEYKKREHRYTKLPFKDVLTMRMDELKIKNVDIAAALGYPMPNVIAMMKKGSMRLPESKIGEVSRILQLDPVFVLRKIMEENNPALWDLIAPLMKKSLITENEMALVSLVRNELDGFDPDLTEESDFTQKLVPIIRKIRDRKAAEVEGAKKRIDEEKKAGKKKD